MASPTVDLDRVVSLPDFESAAREILPPQVLDFVAGGSWDELTLTDNAAAFRRYRLRPRVLVGGDAVDLQTEVLGRTIAMPVGISPTSQHGHCHPDAEVATAQAAAEAGALFVLSMMSSRSIEAVAEASAPCGPGPRWFQLYVQRDMGFARSLVERAAAAGYEAIVLSVDMPVPGYRDRDGRWPTPLSSTYANFPSDEGDLRGIASRRRVPLTWDDLETIAGWSSLPLVTKGILVDDDARLAVEHGAAAVWVSNHGGRQLDRVLASIDALEAVVAAVDGRAEVYLDGGVRRGLDVVTALAMGARAVMIGRPAVYALAVGGRPGVRRALDILRFETELALALLGSPSARNVGNDRIARRRRGDDA